MELEIVRFFQGLKCGFLDVFFGIVNTLGTDLLFYLIFFAVYWFYSKSYAFKYMFVYLGTVGTNKVMKTLVKRPRPAGSTESGYSFPSGHAMSYGGATTQLVYEIKRKGCLTKKWQKIDMWVEYILFGLIIAVARMYAGAHFLTDVLAGLILGAFVSTALTFFVNCFLDKTKGKIKYEWVLLGLVPVAIAVFVVVSCTNLITEADTLDKIYRFVGIFLAVVVGYFVDKKFIKFDGKDDSTKEKIIKMSIGLGVMSAGYVLIFLNKTVTFKTGIYYFLFGLLFTVVFPWIFKTINPKENSDEKAN